MKSRRGGCFRPILAGLGLMASLLQARSAFGQTNTVAQPDVVTAPAALQRGELEVWVPKTYVMGRMGDPTARVTEAYPWATLLNEFNRDFPEFKLRFKILEREDFLRRFHSAEQNPPYPDVAFVDNGQELDPLANNGAVVMSGRSRFPYNGWWLSLPGSKNVGAGRAFMLWLARSPHWKPWQLGAAAISQGDIAALQAVAKKTIEDIALGDSHSLSQNMDREACHFDLRSDPGKKVVSIDPLITFGNSRLAFILMSSVGQGEKTFGMEHLALVLRKVGALWKVLVYLPGPLPRLEDILKSFDRLELENGRPEAVAKISLISPADHARIPRYPRGELEWKPLDLSPAEYVVEHQFGQPGQDLWSSSSILPISPSRGESLIRMQIPFGVGQQPHRWRVWAISKTGDVSMSDWRTVDFTN